MERRFHIAIATQKLPTLSGKGKLVLENVRELCRMGWKTDVLAQEVDPRPFTDAGARVVRVLRPPLRREQRLQWFAWRAQRHASRSDALLVGHGESLLRQDVLHVHNLLHRTHEAVRGTVLEVSAEGSAARMQRRIFAARGYRHVIANSQLVREDLIRRYGLSNSDVTVVHPGYDPERFYVGEDEQAARLRAELGVQPGEHLIGLITSGDFAKRGVDAFLKSLSRLPIDIRDRLHVIVAGADYARGPYQELAQQSGMGARIHLVPPRDDVESLYRALDVYVHPARFEEFGMSVIEAMACGVPTVTGTHVGAAERVEGPARELLLSSSDPGLIAARVSQCLENTECRALLRDAGLAAVRGCTWTENVSAHVRCYEEYASRRDANERARPSTKQATARDA
ncbi:MAG: glycosyltransferase family 4 protein [bacterium]|nr:glycosyltransferase family 4 protein [bacterium]